MSHTKYHTDAFVLGGVNTGEADRFLWLYTRDFGLIGVQTKSLRKVSSKQRFALQDFSSPRVSLVKGRSMWRLTNVSPGLNFYHAHAGTDRASHIARILTFVKRLIQGEEENKSLFSILEKSLLEASSAKTESLPVLEQLVYIRSLYLLGYVEKTGQMEKVLGDAEDFSPEALAEGCAFFSEIRTAVEKALEESQM